VTILSPGDGLLELSAERAAARLALLQVDRLREARRALAAGDDPEALHDLRVALRRLRSFERAFRPELAAATGKRWRRELRDLARSTNAARDAEVGAARLTAWQDAARSDAERRAAGHHAAELAARRAGEQRRIESELVAAAGTLADRLERRLLAAAPAARELAAVELTYAARLRDELETHAVVFFEALSATRSAASPQAHTARIEAKRLRYLLEPVGDAIPAARSAVKRLKGVQDRLGDLHDLDVLADLLADSASRAERARLLRVAGAGGPARRIPGGRRGRLALVRRLASERRELWTKFDSGWLSGAAGERQRLSADLEALLAELDQSARAERASARDIQSS